MAMKQYVGVWEQGANLSQIFDMAGNKVMEWSNKNHQDYGHYFFQRTPGGAVYDIDWDGNYVKRDTEGANLTELTFSGGLSGAPVIGQNIDSNGNYYFAAMSNSYPVDPNPDSKVVIYRFTPGTVNKFSVADGTIVADGRTNADGWLNGTDQWTATGIGGRVAIANINGVESIIVLLPNDTTTTTWLYHRPCDLSVGWTGVNITAALSGVSWPSAFVHIAANVLVLHSNTFAPANTTSFFTCDLNTLPLTVVPHVISDTVDALNEFTSMVEARVPVCEGNFFYGQYVTSPDGIRRIGKFNVLTGALVSNVPMPTTFDDGMYYTIVDGYNVSSVSSHQALIPLANGKIMSDCHIFSPDDTNHAGYRSDGVAIYSADMTTLEKVCHVTNYGTRRIYTMDPLYFNAHQITGNVKIGGVNTAGLVVGILNKDGVCATKTKTDVNGNYTLPCLDGNPKQVIVYEPSGKTTMHLVTPTEVL